MRATAGSSKGFRGGGSSGHFSQEAHRKIERVSCLHSVGNDFVQQTIKVHANVLLDDRTEGLPPTPT